MQTWPGSRLYLSLEFQRYGSFRVRQLLWQMPDGSYWETHYYSIFIVTTANTFASDEQVGTSFGASDGDTVSSLVRALHLYLNQSKANQASLRQQLTQLRGGEGAAARREDELAHHQQVPHQAKLDESLPQSIEEQLRSIKTTIQLLTKRYKRVSRALTEVEVRYHDDIQHQQQQKDLAEQNRKKLREQQILECLKRAAPWWKQPEGEWWMQGATIGEMVGSFGPFQVYRVLHYQPPDEQNESVTSGKALARHRDWPPDRYVTVRFASEEATFWLTWPGVASFTLMQRHWTYIRLHIGNWLEWLDVTIKMAQAELEQATVPATDVARIHAGLEELLLHSRLVTEAQRHQDRLMWSTAEPTTY